ncbi:bifunctional 4-hydroxy-2-oxoglutarate aldolase/2-dehydro-3-deoxy-phosphogluconate aldolase [Tersicoccus sp. MR15.9]|uniref:bifunctional 4-hydroxy-2-oxoglutarate aldolase/2-dehydro-3-deoxy-phosphogluconate aldolase n=1 Tax=Tersicoccus mangrovi TaxID=3121635 RepID=UPI002FE6425A
MTDMHTHSHAADDTAADTVADIRAVAARLGIVPVIVLDSVDDAVPLGEALVRGGLPVAEVTFRTAAAEESLARMAQIDGLLVGAGTLRTPEQVAAAARAGARFAVTPGLSPRIVDACRKHGLPLLPGVSSATDIHAATELGLSVLKFFPAQASGGAPAIAALSAPFGDVRFMPTGGVSPDNLADYLRLPSVLAAGGSWMVAPDLIRAGRWEEIERRCRDAVRQAADLRAH